MGQQDPILRFIPEGVETGLLLVLMALALMLVLKIATRKRWPVCFTSMLITWVFGILLSMPILGFGSRLIGPAALLICFPVTYAAAYVSTAGIVDRTPVRRLMLSSALTIVLAVFGFMIFVLPTMRAAGHPMETREYNVCYRRLLTVGRALNRYTADNGGKYPPTETAQKALLAPRGLHGPYLEDGSALKCPARRRVRLLNETSPLELIGDFEYAQPSTRDPDDTYVLACRRHTHVRRFWSERVGFYLRKDGKVDVIPLAMPQ